MNNFVNDGHNFNYFNNDFSLRLGVQSNQTEEQLLKLDEQGLSTNFKVGIMYCQAGQASEEDMYNNEEAGPAFLEFLDTIGQRVRLKGFDKYRAGLDNKSESCFVVLLVVVVVVLFLILFFI